MNLPRSFPGASWTISPAPTQLEAKLVGVVPRVGLSKKLPPGEEVGSKLLYLQLVV